MRHEPFPHYYLGVRDERTERRSWLDRWRRRRQLRRWLRRRRDGA